MTMLIQFFQPFGAEITHIEIATASQTSAEHIARILVQHRVVVLREQSASDTDLVQFLKRFGELTFTEGEIPVAGASDLNVVSNVGRTTPARSVFHTDTSYVQRPPAIGALRAVLLPEAGGCTLFSDQVHAAAALPKKILDRLRGQTLLHSAKGQDGLVRQARHPVLRRHPTSGEESLFLSTPERCSGLSNTDEESSVRIVDILYRRSVRPARLYRHAWRRGDIVIWDNRVTMHRADHANVIGDRVLHRGLILGESPLPA